MDKYQLTELMGDVKKFITHPETSLFDVSADIIEEILNPPTDKEGYVHKYYLNDSTKIMVESLASAMKIVVDKM